MRATALVLLLLAAGCASARGESSEEESDGGYYRSDECVACGTVRVTTRFSESIRLSDLARSPLLAVLHRHEWAVWTESTDDWIACGRHGMNNGLVERLESSADLRESLQLCIREGEITAAELERALHVRERNLDEFTVSERANFRRVLSVATSCPEWTTR